MTREQLIARLDEISRESMDDRPYVSAVLLSLSASLAEHDDARIESLAHEAKRFALKRLKWHRAKHN